MRYIPRWVVSLALLFLVTGVLFGLILLGLVATGFVTKDSSRSWLIIPIASMLFLGLSIATMCTSAVIENIHRNRDKDTTFICLSRYGSPLSSSFIYSQFLMSLGSCLGVGCIGGSSWLFLRYMKMIGLLSLFLISFAVAEDAPLPEQQGCAKNNDCLLVGGPCGNKYAVHKSQARFYDVPFLSKKKKAACEAEGKKAVCVQNLCAVESKH